MRVVAIVPARLGSTRLPRKVLADIHGKPLIWHVWNQVRQVPSFADVRIATDSDEVRSIVEAWGGQVLMTSPECQSGTERIASVTDQLEADLIVNVQGDEPLVDPMMLDKLVHELLTNPTDLITPVFRIDSLSDLESESIVKVARTSSGQALYFSRNVIPFVRDLPKEQWLDHYAFWGHIGVYGYRRDILTTYPSLPVSRLEQSEKLEQLRFLDAGYHIHTTETIYRSIAVDVQDDLLRVRAIMANKIR